MKPHVAASRGSSGQDKFLVPLIFLDFARIRVLSAKAVCSGVVHSKFQSAMYNRIVELLRYDTRTYITLYVCIYNT